jgi:hypothetical protein
MSWGSSGGGGVSPAPGTPDAAAGADALRPRHTGPRDENPPPRSGCLRTAIVLIVALGIVVVVLYALGGVMSPAS